MNVLVLGRTGQLARALACRAKEGWSFLGREDVDLTQPDVAASAIREARPKAVINAAAYTAVDKAESDAATAHRVNGEGVREVAEATAETAAMLVHISTDYVFDGDTDRPWREDDPTGPLGVYGESKLEGEKAALAVNPRTVILRTAWVYSPWGRNFVLTMLRLAGERDSLGVVGDQRGSPTSALDLARACRRVVAELVEAPQDDPRWGIYHYAGRGETSWAGFAREIFARAEGRLIESAPKVSAITTDEYPTPAHRPARSVLNCSKFANTFGLAPVSWRTALGETLDRIAEERGA